MPRAKAPKSTSETPKPRARRKARPKFEVEPEQVATPAAGWVYREGATESTAAKGMTATHAAAPAVIAKADTKSAPAPNQSPAASIPMMAFGVMAVGIATFVHIALFAVKTLNSPVRMASGILGRLRRA